MVTWLSNPGTSALRTRATWVFLATLSSVAPSRHSMSCIMTKKLQHHMGRILGGVFPPVQAGAVSLLSLSYYCCCSASGWCDPENQRITLSNDELFSLKTERHETHCRHQFQNIEPVLAPFKKGRHKQLHIFNHLTAYFSMTPVKRGKGQLWSAYNSQALSPECMISFYHHSNSMRSVP